METGGGDAADPITARMLTGLGGAGFTGPLTGEGALDGEVELSLGLSVGGNKRKVGDGEVLTGSVSAIGSEGESVDPNRKCRARLECPKGDGGIRNPVTVLPMFVPVANGSGFSPVVSRRAPLVVSDPSRSLPRFAEPTFNRGISAIINPNPNHGEKISAMTKWTPPLSGGSPARRSSSPHARGSSSSSSSSESRSNPTAADQKRKEPNMQEVGLKHGTRAAAVGGSSESKVDDYLMPRVMTRGPYGGMTTGFLYKYSEEEVSIVCVCHGSSFSPAEFVKHAGGRESSNPLRQIMVVPF